MSTWPNASFAFATSSSGTPGLVRSPANTAVSPSISPAACSATSPSMSLISTLAPSLTNSSAVARPMPRAEPVMIAALPSSSPIYALSPLEGLVVSGNRIPFDRVLASAHPGGERRSDPALLRGVRGAGRCGDGCLLRTPRPFLGPRVRRPRGSRAGRDVADAHRPSRRFEDRVAGARGRRRPRIGPLARPLHVHADRPAGTQRRPGPVPVRGRADRRALRRVRLPPLVAAGARNAGPPARLDAAPARVGAAA